MRSPDLPGRLQEILGDTYQLERELGGGGMSRVFLATETALGRRIVFKVLPPELAAEVSTGRFKQEIQLAAQLSHPHIVPLLSAASSGGLLYYTMPWVEGESLRSLMDREQQLPVEMAVQLAREVADALDYAHTRRIIHRDIKPANILLSAGHALVTDFGIARAVSEATGDGSRLTSATVAVGTPAYMSPEQASGERDIDGRSDIYALACVLFEMLAGQPPFTGPTQQAVIARRFTEPAPKVQRFRESVPQWLDEAVARGLASTPADRFQTAREFAHALAPSSTSGSSPTFSASTEKSAVTRASTRNRALPKGLIVFLALVALAAIAYAALQLRDVSADRGDAVSRVSAASADAPATIAVLPFANLSADEENEFFADGMTEELINSLSGIEGLRVAARSSVFALKGSKLDVRTVGDTLGVDAILEGTVRRAGTRLRVTTQLVNAGDGLQIWAQDYDRELSDVFKVQDEIARAIVSALRVKLVRTTTRTAYSERPTSNTEAYDLYLKGRFLLNSQGTPALRLALEHFERAVALDPSFARAYSGIADARASIGVLGLGDPQVEMPKAKAAVLQALALDSSLAEAHASLAHILFVWEWNYPLAERSFRKAFTLDPYGARRWVYGILLLSQKRVPEAENEFRTARALEPLLPHTSSLLGRFFVSTGQADSAIKYLQEAIDLGPNLDLAFQQLGHAYLQKGMNREAIEAFRRAASLSGARDSAHLAYAYSVTGNRDEAGRIMRELAKGSSGRYLSPVDMAIGYAGLGQKDEAFRWLERGLRERAPFMDGIRAMTGLESLRSDPRFANLLSRMSPRE